jgi:hypothetical protein
LVTEKSKGVTSTERYLAELCENSFLKLWTYPNPFKADGKELCDLLVVFENDVLIFFDRESHRLKSDNLNLTIEWPRWRREVVDKQIRSAKGAERYITSARPIFLDENGQSLFPLEIPQNAKIHKIVVAHGAMEACRANSAENVSGSLALSYGTSETAPINEPFFIELDRNDPVHVLDSENLGIVLSELDTIYDFIKYLNAKYAAIKRHDLLTYCGEEDLVAHYLLNYNKKSKEHYIGADKGINFVHIGEGEYADFRRSPRYFRRQSANHTSYLWDRLIQITSQNALNDTLIGNGNPFTGRSAVHFMAKEPRFVRRTLSDHILRAIREFPENDSPIMRNLTFLPSFFDTAAYVFLQLKVTEKERYGGEYRSIRTKMLEVACAAAKLKFPKLVRVIGIGIDAPKFAEVNSEDLLLMEFDDWTEERAREYEELNAAIGFFKTGKERREKHFEFPPKQPILSSERSKLGRNDQCFCGSGKKYKHCHLV